MWSVIKDWYGVELPPTAEILYCESHSDWSWGAVLVVWQDSGKLFYNEDAENWRPVETTTEEALQMMIDFDEIKT